jgi:hypothetical protein
MHLLDYVLLVLATAAGLAAAVGGIMLTLPSPRYRAAKAAFWFAAMCFGSLGILWGANAANYPLSVRLIAAGSTAAIAAMALTYMLSLAVGGRESTKTLEPLAEPAVLVPTIVELYRTDFSNLLKAGYEFNMGFATGAKVTIKTSVYFDFDAHSKFLGVFIPASPATVAACVGIIHDREKLLRETTGGIVASTKISGEWSPTITTDLPFSGRVYVPRKSALHS